MADPDEKQTVAVDTNGTGPNTSIEPRGHTPQPQLEKLFMSEGQGTNFSAIKEMFGGSFDPELYMMRTVFESEEDLRDYCLEVSQIIRMTLGHSDAALMNWLELMGRPAIKGLARNQVKEMFAGERAREKEMASGILGRFRGLGRGDGVNQEQKGR